jgi:hypothetical protein
MASVAEWAEELHGNHGYPPTLNYALLLQLTMLNIEPRSRLLRKAATHGP